MTLTRKQVRHALAILAGMIRGNGNWPSHIASELVLNKKR